MNKASSRPRSTLGIIRRIFFKYLDARTLRLLYTGLVRPHIEYAYIVWNTYKMKHIDMIENVQRRATILVPGLKKHLIMMID